MISSADPQLAAPIQPGDTDLVVNYRVEEMEAYDDGPQRTIREEIVKTERVSVCSGSDWIPQDGLGRRVALSIPSFIPSFTICDG